MLIPFVAVAGFIVADVAPEQTLRYLRRAKDGYAKPFPEQAEQHQLQIMDVLIKLRQFSEAEPMVIQTESDETLELKKTTSIGVAVYSAGETRDALIKKADTATSFAAFKTAGSVPLASPARRARFNAGKSP